MKKILGFILGLLSAGLPVCAQAAVVTAPGSLMLDPSNWITGLDDLYATYDMVTNTITQIENQYTQIQMAIEAAKGIDWSSVKFDGDLDIRNDIKDANKKVNKLLNQARKIKNTVTAKNISVGGFSYSLGDLCGANGADHNFFAACKDVKNYMSANMKMFVKHMTSELTEEEKKAIWKKYKISPENYLFVQQSVAQVKQAAFNAVTAADEDARDLYYAAKVVETNDVLKAMYATMDKDGNPTSAAAQQALVALAEKIVLGLADTKTTMDQVAGVIANVQLAEEQEKQAELDNNEKTESMQHYMDDTVPNRFKR